MLRYQVDACTQIGLKMLLFLVLLLVTWQALSPQPMEPTQLINDKLGHALVFLMLAALTDHAYATTHFNWTKTLWLLAYGLAIESLQHYIPERHFSLLDLLADAAGIAVYWLFALFIFKRTLTKANTKEQKPQ